MDAENVFVQELARREQEVWDRICRAGGSKSSVTLVAVSKKFPVATVEAGIAAGFRNFGENYSQELCEKAAALKPDLSLPAWHFIGGLQRNKVKKLASLVSVWHTVDRLSLIDEIATRCPGAAIYIQVNATGESQKFGCQLRDADRFVGHALDCGLDVKGLMTLGASDGSDPRFVFEKVRILNDRLGLSELSMGMSADFEKAISCGSTCVRLGSIIFGQRK